MPKKDYCEKFEYMWERRPRRSGPDSKANAYKAWNARIKEGYSERDMILGLKAYGKHCAREGKLGTAFVMQMQTFFGPAIHFESEYQADIIQPMELQNIKPVAPKKLKDMSGEELRALDTDTSWAASGNQANAGDDFIYGSVVVEAVEHNDEGWWL